MFTLPGLKLDKGCNYLEKQLLHQKNNQEQILDIINSPEINIKSSCYTNIIEDANSVLNTISNNISSIEKLNLELKKLNDEINNVISTQPKRKKTKKFYLELFPDLENNLSLYSKSFYEIETKLENDNISFVEFIEKANSSNDSSNETEKIENAENINEKNNNLPENIINTEKTCTENNNFSEEITLESENFINEFDEFNLNSQINLAFIEKINNTTSFDFNYLFSEEPIEFSSSNLVQDTSLENSSTPPENSIPSENPVPSENSNEFLDNKLTNNSDIQDSIESDLSKIENKKEKAILVASCNKTNLEIKNESLNKDSYKEKIEKIENGMEDNKTLLISERLGKIYLPYRKNELSYYTEKYPDKYNSLQDVVNQKYTLPFTFFKKTSSKTRFSETYDLLKNRDGQNFIKSVSYAFKITGKRNLNPTIIASCKNKFELDSYIYYLDSNNLNNFRFFDIIYEVNPLNNKSQI